MSNAREQAEQRAIAAESDRDRDGDVGQDGRQAREKEYEEALALKEAQKAELVQKVKQLVARLRLVQEKQQQQDAAAAVEGAQTASDCGVTVSANEDVEELKAQLSRSQEDNDKLVSRLKELARRYRALQAHGQDLGATASVPPPTATDNGRLADAEWELVAANERVAELSRRCQEAEAAHESATVSLNDALSRLAQLQSSADSATDDAAAVATAAGDDAERKEKELRAENRQHEEKIHVLLEDLRASREEKEEVSGQLAAKSADVEKLVRNMLTFTCSCV